MSDLYSILGVDKTASCQEITKAYRKLAKIHHPDRASSNVIDEDLKTQHHEKYIEIKNAYDILSDADKRTVYDRHGIDGVKHFDQNAQNAQNAQNFGSFPFGNFSFGNMFNQSSHFSQSTNQNSQTSQNMFVRMQPKIMKQFFTFTELYNGCKKVIKYDTILLDDNAQSMYECGKEAKEKEVTIPPKTPYRKQINLQREGARHKSKNVICDLIIIIEHDPTDENIWSFDDNDNVFCTIKLSLAESLLGFVKVLPDPSGIAEKLITIKSDNILSSCTKLLNVSGHSVHLNFVVNYQEKLTSKQHRLISEVFNYAKVQVPSGSGVVNINTLQNNANASSNNTHEHAHEHEQEQETGVQCNQQ